MSLADVSIGAGIAQGSRYAASQFTDQRQAERASARATKEAKQQELDKLRATRPTEQDLANEADIASIELETLKTQAKQNQARQNERVTYEGMRRYTQDPGGARHLNQMFKDLKANGNTTFDYVVRVDPISEEDRVEMENLGLNFDAIMADPDLKNSYIRTTRTDGTTEVGNMDNIKGMMRYNQYATTEEMAIQKQNAMKQQLMAFGYDATPVGQEAFRRARADLPNDAPDSPAMQEAITRHMEALKKEGYNGRGRGPENKTEREAEAARRVGMEGLKPSDPGYDAAFSQAMTDVNAEWGRPSSTRNIEGAETARQELEDAGFWDMDFQNMSQRERSAVEPNIRRIEKLAGAELSSADKNQLVRIQELTSLGDMASDLSPEQTGIIDNVLRSAKKYIFNDVDGIDSEAAYAAYRNVVKHSLYGASLQPGESENFIAQFGSLSQQHGPVMAQLRTSLEQLKSNYESILQLNDPMVLAYRTGKTGAELEDVVNALDDRIEMIDNIANDRPVTVAAPKTSGATATHIRPDMRVMMEGLRGTPAPLDIESQSQPIAVGDNR